MKSKKEKILFWFVMIIEIILTLAICVDIFMFPLSITLFSLNGFEIAKVGLILLINFVILCFPTFFIPLQMKKREAKLKSYCNKQ